MSIQGLSACAQETHIRRAGEVSSKEVVIKRRDEGRRLSLQGKLLDPLLHE